MGTSGGKWGKVEKVVDNSLPTRKMFIGEYTHKLDDKGRVPVPVKFRSGLKTGAVITRGLDDSLFLYTKEEWQTMADRISKLPMSNASARSFSRLMLAGAMEVALDKQGRVIIPPYLRDFAGLSKNIVFAGLMNRVELWDEYRWRRYQKKMENSVTTITDDLAELGV